jgi:hypothetical protein
MAVLPDEPVWRLARVGLAVMAFLVMLGWLLPWYQVLVEAVAQVFPPLCRALAPSRPDAQTCVADLHAMTLPLAAVVLGIFLVLSFASIVILWRASRLRVPEPTAVLVWDGRAWSFGTVPPHTATEPSTWPRLDGVVPRVRLDLGGWMLLQIQLAPGVGGRPAGPGRFLAMRPRGVWRAVSRRGAAGAWTPLRAALGAMR